MKGWLGLTGVLLAAAVIALLARSQNPVRPAAAAPASQPAATPQQQVQQFKQAVDASLQLPAREMPDDGK